MTSIDVAVVLTTLVLTVVALLSSKKPQPWAQANSLPDLFSPRIRMGASLLTSLPETCGAGAAGAADAVAASAAARRRSAR